MKTFRRFFKLFIFHLCLFRISKADNYENSEKLRSKLLQNYDKLSLPHRNVNGTTDVEFRMKPRRIFLDDDTQIFTLNGWSVMFWIDDRLKWDVKDYGNLERLHFGDHELWKPDIQVYNNADGSEIDHYGNVHFLVYYNGQVLWVPPAVMKVPCAINLKFWPFDTQECKIELGSWTSSGAQINLIFYINTTELKVPDMLLEDSDKWKIIKATQKRNIYEWNKEPYIDLQFFFKIKRNSPNFGAFVVVPAVVIPIFLMIQFILPVNHSKRLSIGFISLILVMMELLFLKYSIPKIGSNVPLVVTYYVQCLIMVVLTVFISSILGRLSHPMHPLLDFSPPEFIKTILTGPLAVILCVSTNANKVGMSGQSTEEGEVLTETKNQSFSHEWLLVAKVVDRLSFILITSIFIFSIIGYITPIK